MSAPTLSARLEDYLTLRRAMGFKMERHEKLLGQFVDYLTGLGCDTVTVDHALAWATSPTGADPRWWAARLSMARGFAAYLHTLDPAHQVPPARMISHGGRRVIPHLYTDEEVLGLLDAAARLPGRPMRSETYRVLIGLLFTTGMRVGEAISVDRRDFDARAGVLIVREGKFTKSRLLPLHPTTTSVLERYLDQCDRLVPQPQTTALLLSTNGCRLRYERVWTTFHRLLDDAGLVLPPPASSPRIHDMRHSFAVRTLLDWYRDGADVPAMLPRLSTYLGHADPKHTYWYLSAAPELLALAAERLQTSKERS